MPATPFEPPTPRKVLIVDDEPGMARLMACILSAGGYIAEAAIGGQAGWTRFEAEPWDAVVTDWTMDGVSGDELTRRIQERAPGTPIILATGHVKGVKNAHRFSTVMTKPFGRMELLTAIGQVFAHPEHLAKTA